MDRVYYDKPNIDRINEFLKRLKRLKPESGNPQLSVYETLEKDGLKKRDTKRGRIIKAGDFSSKWNGMTSDGTVRMNRNNRQAFTFFTKGDIPAETLIKLYIPVDKRHLGKSVNLIFQYIKSLGIEHESKVADDIRNDNIVVRLRKKDVRYAIDIINFVNSNSYIKKGLNKPNPFVPTINGIGYLEEVGIDYSYNMALQEYIDNYIYYCWARGIEPDAFGLLDFLKTEDQHCPQEVINTYEKYIRGNGYVNLMNNEEMEQYIQNSFRFNGIECIDKLDEIVDSTDKMFYLESLLTRYYNRRIFYNNKKDLIRHYIYMVYGNALAENIMYVCRTTLENYDMEQLTGALRKYISTGTAEAFSSFNKDNSGFNCREYMEGLDRDTLIYAMRYTLIENGIDANNMNINDLVGGYTSYIEGITRKYSV